MQVHHRTALIVCAVCALTAILALTAYKPPPHEPSYGGHPLSHWVNILSMRFHETPDLRQRYDEATNAINHIGVAALPFLLKWIEGDPPQWKSQLANWVFRARLPFSSRFVDSITRANALVINASDAFLVLGDKATPALNDLCRLMNDTNRPRISFAAFRALHAFGTNAVPPLLAVAANTNHPLHRNAKILAAQIVRQHSPSTATNAPAQ